MALPLALPFDLLLCLALPLDLPLGSVFPLVLGPIDEAALGRALET